jgi:hypothetical protein
VLGFPIEIVRGMKMNRVMENLIIKKFIVIFI